MHGHRARASGSAFVRSRRATSADRLRQTAIRAISASAAAAIRTMPPPPRWRGVTQRRARPHRQWPLARNAPMPVSERTSWSRSPRGPQRSRASVEQRDEPDGEEAAAPRRSPRRIGKIGAALPNTVTPDRGREDGEDERQPQPHRPADHGAARRHCRPIERQDQHREIARSGKREGELTMKATSGSRRLCEQDREPAQGPESRTSTRDTSCTGSASFASEA